MDTRTAARTWWGPAVALLLAGSLLVAFAPAHSRAETRFGRRLYMVSLTNTDRQDHQRAALDLNRRISRYAKHHSEQMAATGYIYHSDSNTLRRILAPYHWSIGGENVGVGGSLNSLESAFMHSKEHRENILRSTFDHMAVGLYRDDDGRLWVTVIFYG